MHLRAVDLGLSTENSIFFCVCFVSLSLSLSSLPLSLSSHSGCKSVCVSLVSVMSVALGGGSIGDDLENEIPKSEDAIAELTCVFFILFPYLLVVSDLNYCFAFPAQCGGGGNLHTHNLWVAVVSTTV